jgi:uncharacterized MAPEG superfamily protein
MAPSGRLAPVAKPRFQPLGRPLITKAAASNDVRCSLTMRCTCKPLPSSFLQPQECRRTLGFKLAQTLGGMNTMFQSYGLSIAALGFISGLMLIQVLISDVLGISKKHISGTTVLPDHSDSLFRASRTVGNTNESIAIFICALLFCILSSASPIYTAFAAWAFVTSRTLYAMFYYANLQTLRSVSFGISLLALGALIVIGALTP